MRIASVGRAFPPNYYPQDHILERLQVLWRNGVPWNERLASLHRNTTVAGRHLTLSLEEYDALPSFGAANDLWIRNACNLGETAIREAIARAEVSLTDIGALFFVSVTGIATPSVDAMLVNRLELPPHVKRTPIFGLGCVAGAAGLARAADYARAFPDQAAVLLSVELCSLTFQRDDKSVPNMIATGLFGDAASAVVVTGAGLAGRGPRIVDTRSVFYADTEHVMGWNVSEKGFQLVLSPVVHEVVESHLASDVDAFLEGNGLTRKDISRWICHSGGPKVIDAIQGSLGLATDDLALTRQSLRDVGNVSSASVLLVLGDTLDRDPPPSGSHGMLLALGPGFCSELVLLRF